MNPVFEENVGGRLYFRCPACKHLHGIRYGDGPGPRWDWNGDFFKPTVQPSVLVTWNEGENNPKACHSYITDGRIQFLSDCTHALAGQTVDLPAVKMRKDT